MELLGGVTIITSATIRELSAWRYNRTTLFLGDKNAGNWLSRLGESQLRE
jgi:hypothetical protein